MLNRALEVVLLLAAFPALVGAGAPVPTIAPLDGPALPAAGPSMPSGFDLGFGIGVQIDRPFQEVGSEALAAVFFFNHSPQDAWGVGYPVAVEGCSFITSIRDEKGRLVRQTPPCPIAAPIGPILLQSGAFLRWDVPLPLEYRTSETGDPDGSLLPGGLYTLEAVSFFDGPRPSNGPFAGPGGDPEARVPFRIYRCSQATGTGLPIRDLGEGEMSGYRYGDPAFHGEDFVLRTEGAALQLWQEHTSHISPPQPPPFVDFSREMVLVALMGYQPWGGGPWIRIRSVEEKPCHLEVTVEEAWIPGPLAVITNPYHIVTIPRSMKEVVFLHMVMIP